MPKLIISNTDFIIFNAKFLNNQHLESRLDDLDLLRDSGEHSLFKAIELVKAAPVVMPKSIILNNNKIHHQ